MNFPRNNLKPVVITY